MKIASSSQAKVFSDPTKREYKTRLLGPIGNLRQKASMHSSLSACSCYTGVLHGLQAVVSKFLKDMVMGRDHYSR